MRRRLFAWLVCLALVPGLGADSGNRPSERPEDGLRLLFIGNSLTYTNDLPQMLAWLLQRNGTPVAAFESRARPNYGLPDHWNSSQTLDSIDSGDWDYVIMQQGPSATEGRPYLLEYAPLFADRVRATGGAPVFYMVWPSAARLRDFPLVAESYRMAADQAGAGLFPVGEAWMEAWRRDPALGLYGRDGFHPSRLGTYLAALVMYQQLSGNKPTELPAAIPGYRKDDPVDEGTARLLQQAAMAANARVGDQP